MSAPAKLYVQCNPLLDISSNVSDDFLKKYKIQRSSATLMAKEQADIFAELEKMPNVKYIPGGSGLNTARVAQWMLQAPKGSFVTYVGCVSNDRYGKILREFAEKEGVNMAVEYTTREPTGSCAVCITEKERALVANLAAANCLSADHVFSPQIQNHRAEAKLFYFTGYTLTIDVSYVIKVAEEVKNAGGTFMINLSAPFIIEFFGEQLHKVLPYVDIIFGNEMEAKTLAKVKEWNTEDVMEIAMRALVELPYDGTKNRVIVFTQGKNPTIYVTKETASVVHVDPLDQDKIIDLNAAGDAFVGGFLAAYALERELKQCCLAGHYAARVVIQQDACTYPEKPNFSL